MQRRDRGGRRRAQARPPGQVDRGPQREPDRRRPRPRPEHATVSLRARRRRRGARRAHRPDGERRRVPGRRLRLHAAGRDGRLPRPVPHRGVRRRRPGVLHQHLRPLRLPRAVDDRDHRARADDGRGGRRTRHRPAGATPAQRDPARRPALHHRGRAGLRGDQPGTDPRAGRGAHRLRRVPRLQQAGPGGGPAGRHRDVGVHRAAGRRRASWPPRPPPSASSRAAPSTCYMGTGSHGQSLETTIVQVVADHLGVALDDVHLIQGDTAATPYGPGTGGSRSAIVASGAAAQASDSMRDRVLAIAAALLEANPEDLAMADSRISVRRRPGRRALAGRGGRGRLPQPGRAAAGHARRARGVRAVPGPDDQLLQRRPRLHRARSTRPPAWCGSCATWSARTAAT